LSPVDIHQNRFYQVRPAVFQSHRVSPVALAHPVVVSPVVDVLAALRAAVSPVLAMRWFSFVHEALFPQWNHTG